MLRGSKLALSAAIAAIGAFGYCPSAWGVAFVTGYIDGESWNFLYAQGFAPFVRPDPDPFADPGLGLEETVRLDRFRFFKAGFVDEATSPVAENFQLAIVSNYFLDLSTFTTSSPELVGLSTNTIATSEAFATGAPIDFEFESIELSYGAIDYAAILVHNDAGALSIVGVPVLIADYLETEPGSGVYVPESDYGDPDADYVYSASNFFTGNYLNTFNAPYADGSFVAYFNLDEAGLTGDYNENNVVDAADYTVWRDHMDQMFQLPNEDLATTPGQVTIGDYEVWVANFGKTASGGGAGALALEGAVPEPHVAVLACLAAISALAAGRLRKTTDR